MEGLDNKIYSAGGKEVVFPFDLYPQQREILDLLRYCIENRCNGLIDSGTGTGKSLPIVLYPAVALPDNMRLVVATRTHGQMEQLAKMMKESKYSDIRAVCLASRDRYCASDRARSSKEPLNIACYNSRQADDSCGYFSGSKNTGPLQLVQHYKNIGSSVTDIEDLMKQGRVPTCPYYSAREVARSMARVIFCPYNYVLENNLPFTIDKNTFIVFDEAHNIEPFAESCLESTISRSELLGVIKSAEDIKGTDIGTIVKACKSVLSMFDMLRSASKELEVPSSKLEKLFDRGFLESVDLAFRNLKKKHRVFVFKADPLKKFLGTIMAYSPCTETTHDFVEKHYGGVLEFKNGRWDRVTLRSFSPELVMKKLAATGAVIILASGTIQEQNYVEERLGIKFGKAIQNKPIVKEGNAVFVGDYSLHISGRYELRNQSYYSLVGRAVSIWLHKIRGGVLVFLKSFSDIRECKKNWSSTNLLTEMEKVKKVFICEDTHSTKGLLEDYRQCVLGGGEAVLFTVFRSTASEGLDFPDELCRGVVLAGLPWQNVNNVEGRIRKRTLGNEMYKKWRVNDMLSSCFQAIGRLIRHRDDYGVVVLIDKDYKKFEDRLPKWLIRCHDYKPTSLVSENPKSGEPPN